MSDTGYVARYMRFHKESAEECDSLDEAVAFLSEGADRGWCSPLDVVGSDGVVALGGATLRSRMDVYRGV